jgi:hypothetical protein
MSGDPLGEVSHRLDALSSAPVSAHADVLEEVHRVIVAELDALAGAGSVDPARARTAG